MTNNKKHILREHLALISTEVYLLLRTNNEEERIKRYKRVQEQIDAILHDVEDVPQPYSASNDLTI